MTIKHFPATWMRGGTSKGLFIDPRNLPENPIFRDQLLLAAIGSPDPYEKQIDGLGGATSSTSKIVLIKPSDKEGFDVDYTFGHVAIAQAVIDYSGNCGNLSSAVGIFAIEQGMIKTGSSGMTSVRVWQTNLSQKMIVHVPTSTDGNVINNGNYQIAGVANTGSPIKVEFIKPGAKNGIVLPTGKTSEALIYDQNKKINVSLVIAGNATVFVDAKDLGLKGTELPDQINADQKLLDQVEKVRCAASVKMGLAETVEQASQQPATPKLAFVSKAQNYHSAQRSLIESKEMDLCARIFSMGKLHHALTGTGAIAIAVAASIPDTLIYNCVTEKKQPSKLSIGHSAGLMEASAVTENINGNWLAYSASIMRTARTLMRGEVIIPDHYVA
ncbi:MAG: 2-methylaconitate cis-trans isomerase PrpF family protein [Gammaproteobacteria bacterium]